MSRMGWDLRLAEVLVREELVLESLVTALLPLVLVATTELLLVVDSLHELLIMS